MSGSPIAALAWAGFGLDLLVSLALYAAVSTAPEPFFLGSLSMGRLLKLALLASLIQALSLFLLWRGAVSAVALAWIGGLLMMPLGFLFIEGCMISRQRAKFGGLAGKAPNTEIPLHRYPNMAPENNFYVGLVVSCIGLLLFLLGVLGGFGLYLLFFGAIVAMRGLRLKNRPVLGLYRSYFTVTPNVWADLYAIPYKAVRYSNVEEKKISLVVEDAYGKKHAFKVPLGQIAQRERAEAATNFAARLAVDADMLARQKGGEPAHASPTPDTNEPH